MSDLNITEPRRFHLIRKEDETGVSGTGVVAEGLEFTDGTVAMRWLTGTASTAVYASVDDVRTIHGHGGKTVVFWFDSDASKAADATRARYGEVWTELAAWVREVVDDGEGLDRDGVAALHAYMGELRRKALAPMRDWMRALTPKDPA